MEMIAGNVWKVKSFSNVYLIGDEENIIIDTSARANIGKVEKELGERLSSVTKVIFTHFHHDHIANFNLFKNAEFYASKSEIEAHKKDPFGAILDEQIVKEFGIDVNPVEKLKLSDFGMKLLLTPGHTIGSICILDEKRKILFSGDTLFPGGEIGRTIYPTSAPEKMEESLKLIKNQNFEILAAGHR